MGANAEMILRYYGVKTQSEVRMSSDREALIESGLNRADGDVVVLKAYIDE